MRVAGPQPNMPQLRSTTRSNAPSVAGSNPRSTSIRRPPASTTATPLAPATAGGVAPAMSTATQRCAPAPPRSRCRRRFRYASSVETFSPRLSQNIRRLSPLAANSRANCSVSPGVRRRAALVSSLPIPPLKHHPRRSERWVGLTDTLIQQCPIHAQFLGQRADVVTAQHTRHRHLAELPRIPPYSSFCHLQPLSLQSVAIPTVSI